jgi:hypothetical protein
MAYLHCHSCDWSQDDYWDFRLTRKYGYLNIKWLGIGWGYNPISCFLSELFGKHGYLRPRRIKFDSYAAKEYGWKRSNPHSWFLLMYEFKRMLRKFKDMRWKTHEAFRKDSDADKAKCPHCGAVNFDVD